MNCYTRTKIAEHANSSNQTCVEQQTAKKFTSLSSKNFMPSNFESCSLSVARCELNNLTDCTSKGLAIGVSHIGGDTRSSIVTIHKTDLAQTYSVRVMDMQVNWDAKNAINQFKQAILRARKIICDHNKLLKMTKSNTTEQPQSA